MLTVQTPAKINLFLNIRGRRPDGLHDVCFVMQAVALWDVLRLTPRFGKKDLAFSCNDPNLVSDGNLVVKAYHAFWQATGLPPLGLEAHLEKNIPVTAGMGGGSSDAAAMLVCLNHLSHANLPSSALREIAGTLGSDVPFFITGGTALATGRGEVIQSIFLDRPLVYPLLVVKPRALDIPTADAYRACQTRAHYESRSPEHLLIAMKKATRAADLEPYLLNDFEEVLFYRYPLLEFMATEMRALGIQRPLLSGSGPSMVGFFEPTPKNRRAVQDRFPSDQFDVFWTQTYPSGPIQKK